MSTTVIESMSDSNKLIFSVIETQRGHVNQNFRTGRTTIKTVKVYKAQYEYADGSKSKFEISKRLYNALIALNDNPPRPF